MSDSPPAPEPSDCPADEAAPAPAGRKGRLHPAAVEALRRMIVRGDLRPGTKLREQELCERLGISRTPLREALKTLAGEGLVRLLPNRSAEVAEIDLGEVMSLFEVVGTLESLAGGLACKTITEEEIAEIGVLHYRMMLHHLRGELPGYFSLNQVIHRRIVEASRNAVLLSVWDSLSARVERARYLPNLRPRRWPAAMREHEEIFAALSGRDGERLGELLRAHLLNGLVAMREGAGEEARRIGGDGPG